MFILLPYNVPQGAKGNSDSSQNSQVYPDDLNPLFPAATLINYTSGD